MTGIRVESKIVWHGQNVEKLKALYETKLSAREIAAHFPGATKNAILGKLHRLGLGCLKVKPARKPPPSPQPKPKISKVRQPPTVPAPDLTPPTADYIQFMDLGSSTCKSVVGYSMQGGRELPYYCGCHRAGPLSFCLYHADIYYRKSSR